MFLGFVASQNRYLFIKIILKTYAAPSEYER